MIHGDTIITVECPECESPAGVACLWDDPRHTDLYHPARVDRADGVSGAPSVVEFDRAVEVSEQV